MNDFVDPNWRAGGYFGPLFYEILDDPLGGCDPRFVATVRCERTIRLSDAAA